MKLRRAQIALLAATAATVPVSVFAADLLLFLTLVVLGVRLVRKETRLGATSADAPLLAFVVWTLLSASFAADPAVSHEVAKKLLLFSLFYLGVEVTRRETARERVLGAVLLGGLAQASLMVLQYHLLGFNHLDRRPHGFLGHYMSAAGVTMVVLLLAAARLACGRRRPPRPRELWLAGGTLAAVAAVAALDAAGHELVGTRIFVAGLAVAAAASSRFAPSPPHDAVNALAWVALPFACWALILSQTRGVWIGAVLGLAGVALLRAPRLLAAVAAAVVLLLIVRPAPFAGRLTVRDASSLDRYYMWQAGIDMVIERPVFGMGPGMILRSYPRYRWPEAPNPNAPHLHNNLLQFAAERGLPGLAFFAWWAIAVVLAAWREARRAKGNAEIAPAAVGAFVVLVATFAAGLFEYNLGDSEVLMLVLLLTAVPFALARSRESSL